MQETQEMSVDSLDQEDLLGEEMATNSSILAWRIPWTEKPAVLQSIGWQTAGLDLMTEHQPQAILSQLQTYPSMFLLRC